MVGKGQFLTQYKKATCLSASLFSWPPVSSVMQLFRSGWCQTVGAGLVSPLRIPAGLPKGFRLVLGPDEGFGWQRHLALESQSSSSCSSFLVSGGMGLCPSELIQQLTLLLLMYETICPRPIVKGSRRGQL